ncbi:mucin-17-like [Lineus longissimus]|uniref:mucin-17-like n=1 Tax=Lineus longissimus TaxID=88925 RepID=UPI00315DA76B
MQSSTSIGVSTTPSSTMQSSTSIGVSTTPSSTMQSSTSIGVSTIPSSTMQSSTSIGVSTTPSSSMQSSTSIGVSTTPSSTMQSSTSIGVSTTPSSSMQSSTSIGVSTTPSSTMQSSTSIGVSTTPSSAMQSSTSIIASTTPSPTMQTSTSVGASTNPSLTMQSSTSIEVSTTPSSAMQSSTSTGASATPFSTTQASTITPTLTTSTTPKTPVLTITTPVPTTTTPAAETGINPGASFVRIFVLTIDFDYGSDILNSTSEAHKKLVKAVVSFMRNVMNFFFHIEYQVTGIRRGSAIVDVKFSVSLADLNNASAASDGSFDLEAAMVSKALDASAHNVTVDNNPVNYTGMVISLQKDAFQTNFTTCDAKPCNPGLQCRNLQPDKPYAFVFTCLAKCKDYSCGIFSECNLNDEGEPFCAYVDSTLKLFIGLSIAGFFVLIIIIGIICLFFKLRRSRKDDGESDTTSSESIHEAPSARNIAFLDGHDQSSIQYDYFDAYLGCKHDSLGKPIRIPRPKVSAKKLGLHHMARSSDEGSSSSPDEGTNTEI